MRNPDFLKQFQEASVKPEGEEREDARLSWAFKRIFDCTTEEAKRLPVDPGAYPIPLSKDSYRWLSEAPSAAVIVYKDNCLPCHVKHEVSMCVARHLTTLDIYTANMREVAHLVPFSVAEKIDGTPFFFTVQKGQFSPLSEERREELWSQCSTKK